MLYIGFDGTGYQTGLAVSADLVHWKREALVGPRDPASTYTKYNLAISSILRDKNLHGPGEALKIDGEYLAAWNAYPSAGYEEGAAVVGLARSPTYCTGRSLNLSSAPKTAPPGSMAASIALTCWLIVEPTTSTSTPRLTPSLNPMAVAGTNKPELPPALTANNGHGH